MHLAYYQISEVLHVPLLIANGIAKAFCVLQNFACKGGGFNFDDMDTNFLVDNLPNRESKVRSQGIDVSVFCAEYILN